MNRKLLINITGLLFIIAILLGFFTYRYNLFTKDTLIPRGQSSSDKDLLEYYEEAKSLAKSQEQNQTVTFLAVGDISLSRNIAQTIKIKNDPLYPFRGMEQILKSTDFNFGNLETPFSKSDAFTASNTLVFNAPKTNVAGLKEYNFKVLNLANNHASDQGLDGITTTAKILDDNGLLHMGTGNSLEEAWQPAIIEKNGIKIGFIGASYASVNDGGKATNNYVARIEDTKRLESNVKSLRSNVDFLVVTMHAGTEYTSTANAAQIKLAHTAIDAGADMVIGAHPHWVQNKELYCPHTVSESNDASSGSSPNIGEARRGIINPEHVDTNSYNSDCKPIYYSLGNFIFDQAWSEQTKKGLALKITLSTTSLCHSGLDPESSQINLDAEPRSRMTRNCNHALQGPLTQTNPISIEEIPIYIKENCCATLR